METLVTYIEELVYLHDQVVIPGVGALIAGREGAVIQRGLLVPPSRVASFNRHARYDDGALACWVARREGIDARKARARVVRFRAGLLERLSRGERVTIGALGAFSLGRGGRVIFESTVNELQDDATGAIPLLLPGRAGEELRVGSSVLARLFKYGISAAVIAGIIAIAQSGLFQPGNIAENAAMHPVTPVKRAADAKMVIVSPRHDYVDYTPTW
ncbi:MAG: hypothetical protein LBD64_08475 [Odoribacteraceae bacterium]|jgi:hypothetical protein|nr:hypothetical protein [Odoribacteraceae bacterium]